MSKHSYCNREDGLLHCKICGGAEGELTTECPGRKLTEKELKENYLNNILKLKRKINEHRRTD